MSYFQSVRAVVRTCHERNHRLPSTVRCSQSAVAICDGKSTLNPIVFQTTHNQLKNQIVRCAECPLENANGVTWLPVQTINASDADQRHASTPWCLNDRLYLETRQCVDDNPDAPTGSWLPAKAPDCAVVRQPAEAYHCPIGMDQLRPGSASQAPLCVRLHQVSGGWPSAAAECARLGTERTLLRLDVEEMRLVREYEMWRDNEVFLPAEWIEPHRLRWQLAGQTGGLVEELSARAVGQVARPGNGCAAMRMPDKEDIQEKQAAMEGMVENDIM